VPIVLKSGSLILLETSGPVRAPEKGLLYLSQGVYIMHVALLEITFMPERDNWFCNSSGSI